jgi:hypothetical protein
MRRNSGVGGCGSLGAVGGHRRASGVERIAIFDGGDAAIRAAYHDTATTSRVCTLASIGYDRSLRHISLQILLVNDWHQTHAQTILVSIVAGDPGRLFCPLLLKAGDGFGFGFSSTKWIFGGTDGR